jgi:hypothetical protein
MVTAVFTETLDNFQDSTLFIPRSRSCVLDSSRENLRTRNVLVSISKVCVLKSCSTEANIYCIYLQITYAVGMNVSVFMTESLL